MSPEVINPESHSGNSYIQPGLTLKNSTFCPHSICLSYVYVCYFGNKFGDGRTVLCKV